MADEENTRSLSEYRRAQAMALMAKSNPPDDIDLQSYAEILGVDPQLLRDKSRAELNELADKKLQLTRAKEAARGHDITLQGQKGVAERFAFNKKFFTDAETVKITDSMNTISLLNDLEKGWKESYGGPIQGRLNSLAAKIPFLASVVDGDTQASHAKLASVINAYIKQATGAQLSAYEQDRLSKATPQVWQSDEGFKSVLNVMREAIKRNVKNKLIVDKIRGKDPMVADALAKQFGEDVYEEVRIFESPSSIGSSGATAESPARKFRLPDGNIATVPTEDYEEFLEDFKADFPGETPEEI